MNTDVLTRTQCLELLGETGVGRVAFMGASGPQIYPVNYLVDDETVVVRTAPYTRLAEYATGQVAFEVDDLHPESLRGWSVLVVGSSLPVDDPDEAVALRRSGRLQPWADGPRNLFLRITPREITGRRIGS